MKKLTKILLLFTSIFLVSCSPTNPVKPVDPDEPKFDTISVTEAVNIIDSLEVNVVSEKEYYVRGIVNNVEKDKNGFNGNFLGSNLKFRSIKENGIAENVDDIDGKEVIIYGYLENYKGIYQIPYLPAASSPTGKTYNGKLMWVKPDSTGEVVDVTNVVVSPINKVIGLNESYTLSANILPENATDKSVVWSSDNTAICTVSASGVIKGVAVGNTVITATSSNGITSSCNVTVTDNSDTPPEGYKFEIAFNKFESDGQTELNSSTLLEQITAGSDNISSIEYTEKLYKGINGIKFGSSRSGGEMDLNLSSTISKLNCTEAIVNVSQYGTKSTTVSLKTDDETIATGSSANTQLVAKFDTPRKLSNLSIRTSSRAYVSKITIICEDAEEIPVTAISLPETYEVAAANSDQLKVTYTPSNANRGKKLTWTSLNTSVATVSDGTVVGISPGTTTITATSEGGLTASCEVTVKNVAVTSVSLSSSEETISIGSSKQLTATISPNNASNKNVTWTSSNSSVASVSSLGLVTAKAVGTAVITVKTSDGGKTATCSVTVSEIQKDAWTVMIYMCGADLESESGLASGDIKEILSIANQPDDVNIIIETGGAKSWSLKNTSTKTYLSGATSIDASKLQRWHVEDRKLTFDESLPTYTSMGSSSTLQSFIEYGLEKYPAEKTGLIFWNHGGAMYGCCYDEKKNDDSLTNSEMKTAFSKALANTGSSKLEFVGYDTCLTQVQDIAEFNSNYFNYMIASEEAEAGEGWDYDTWVDDLYAKKTTDKILKAIVDGFIEDNGGVSSKRSDQTLSYLDLAQMPTYKTAFESFASALKTKLSSNGTSKSTFASWMSKNVKAFCVDPDEDEKYYCLFDVKDMLDKLSSSSYNPGSSYISNLTTAFSNLVKYSVAQAGAGNAYGLGCIYCQSSTFSSYIKPAYTSTETNFSNWLDFCKTYSYLA